MVKKVIRLSEVMASTGWAKSTVFAKIKAGKFPKGTELLPRRPSRRLV